MVISARVMPLDRLTKDLLVRTWPRNVMNTVTNDISMVFANSVHTTEAVAGLMPPLDEMALPHRGWYTATMNHIQLRAVEYTERTRTDTESQLMRLAWTSLCESQ